MSTGRNQTTLRHVSAIILMLSMVVSAPLQAAELGAVTNLPIPRFVSVKANKANVRRGPSRTHRIDWVFRHQGLPVIVTGEYGHWRRIVDRDGIGGWIHYSLLSGVRTVIVNEEDVVMRATPDTESKIRAQTEKGVIARLEECDNAWCEIRAQGYRGWVKANTLWGLRFDDGDTTATKD